jgi:type II secretory pathway pseudopilin PulG
LTDMLRIRPVAFTHKRIGPHGWVAILLSLMAAAVFVVASGQARAQQAQTTLQTIPTLIDIYSDEAAQSQVILRNPTSDTLRNVTLTWFSNAPITVSMVTSLPVDIGPFGDQSWTLAVTQTNDIPITGTLYLRAGYTRQSPDGSRASPQVALGSLDVRSGRLVSLDQLVNVDVHTTISSVNEIRPGRIYLVLSNKTGTDLNLERIDPGVPDFVSTTISPTITITQMLNIPPYLSRIVTVDMAAPSSRPGKHLAVFDLSFRWQQAGKTREQNMMVTRILDFSVFGESEILNVLQVPTVLFLPGFLIAMTWWQLWLLSFGRTTDREKMLFKPLSLQFAFLAILLSLLMAFFLYQWLTGLPFITKYLISTNKNYYEEYSLKDIAQVYFLSVLFAAVGFGAVALLAKLNMWLVPKLKPQFSRLANKSRALFWLRLKRWRERNRPNDADPIELLKKLHKIGLNFRRPSGQLQINGGAHAVYGLESADGTNKWSTVYVVSSIEVTWEAPTETAESTQIKEAIKQTLDNPTQDATQLASLTGSLAQLLQKGKTKGYLEVKYDTRGSLTFPYPARKKEVIIPNPGVFQPIINLNDFD